ncbi:hypothetical protein CVT24_002243 [Panaeolus cyanescens]|uniref:Uncharacterized protein n=1 Tax=Panaeolus cyanescens TaxID=181874 RepID=A0A409YIB2_9AGAR|nr:hypothetical protein CVT24_002243 [Panaeolus cyanescens]
MMILVPRALGVQNITVLSHESSINYQPSQGVWNAIGDSGAVNGAYRLARTQDGVATISQTFRAVHFTSPLWPFPLQVVVSVDSESHAIDLQDHSVAAQTPPPTGLTPSSKSSQIRYTFRGTDAQRTVKVSAGSSSTGFTALVESFIFEVGQPGDSPPTAPVSSPVNSGGSNGGGNPSGGGNGGNNSSGGGSGGGGSNPSTGSGSQPDGSGGNNPQTLIAPTPLSSSSIPTASGTPISSISPLGDGSVSPSGLGTSTIIVHSNASAPISNTNSTSPLGSPVAGAGSDPVTSTPPGSPTLPSDPNASPTPGSGTGLASDHDQKRKKMAMIVGIICGILGLLVVAWLIGWYVRKRRERRLEIEREKQEAKRAAEEQWRDEGVLRDQLGHMSTGGSVLGISVPRTTSPRASEVGSRSDPFDDAHAPSPRSLDTWRRELNDIIGNFDSEAMTYRRSSTGSHVSPVRYPAPILYSPPESFPNQVNPFETTASQRASTISSSDRASGFVEISGVVLPRSTRLSSTSNFTSSDSASIQSAADIDSPTIRTMPTELVRSSIVRPPLQVFASAAELPVLSPPPHYSQIVSLSPSLNRSTPQIPPPPPLPSPGQSNPSALALNIVTPTQLGLIMNSNQLHQHSFTGTNNSMATYRRGSISQLSFATTARSFGTPPPKYCSLANMDVTENMTIVGGTVGGTSTSSNGVVGARARLRGEDAGRSDDHVRGRAAVNMLTPPPSPL